MSGNIDWYAALGAPKPESVQTSSGENAQGTAAPATSGENVQESAASASETANTENNPDNSVANNSESVAGESEGQDNSEENKVEKPEGMSKEERAANASRRREAETKLKIDAALAEERQKFEEQQARMMDDTIAALKFVNPFTNKLITTRAEYDGYLKAKDEQKINSSLQQIGIDRSVFDTLIDQHPDVVKAKELAAETQREKTRVLDTAAQEKANAEIAKVQKYDPGIKSIEDLWTQPNYEDIYRLVKAGATISEAYRTVNEDKILEHERKAAAQEAYNTIQSKAHLTTDAQHGKGGVTVPAGVRKNFRAMYGNSITDAEIQKKYEKLGIKKG